MLGVGGRHGVTSLSGVWVCAYVSVFVFVFVFVKCRRLSRLLVKYKYCCTDDVRRHLPQNRIETIYCYSQLLRASTRPLKYIVAALAQDTRDSGKGEQYADQATAFANFLGVTPDM